MSGTFKHTMLDPQFGKLVPDDFPDERDAIHIATAAVYATEDLKPGDHVGHTTKAADHMGKSELAPIGIVDPFLKEPVKAGERFWVFLYPGTINSLRHNWTHPSFDFRAQLIAGVSESPAKKRMKAFAQELDGGQGGVTQHYDGETYSVITFEELISRATAYVQSGDYWSEGGRFESQGVYEGFWADFEELTGIKVEDKDQYGFFSCSC